MGAIPASGAIRAQGEKLRVFISYSRRDLEFVDRLQVALAARGIEAFVDREHIEKGEEWWARIKQLITEADTVVFVLTPGSVGSRVCHDEVDFAEKLNKRFVPIVADDLEGHQVPGALARLNYIFFIRHSATGATDDFESAVDDLVRALETDITWIREHTRLGALALRWEARKRPGDLLLRGAELAAAETWLTTRPEKAPDPTDAHRAFLTESRRAAIKRQRWVVGLSTTAAVVAVALAALAGWQAIVARQNEARAVQGEALAKENEKRAVDGEARAIAGERLARENEQKANEARDAALTAQSQFLSERATQEVTVGNYEKAVLLALAALPDAAGGVVRPYVADAMKPLYAGVSNTRAEGVFQGVPARITDPDIIATNGKILNKVEFDSSGGLIIAAPDDGTVRVWRVVPPLAEVVIRGNGEMLNDFAISPDGGEVITASQNGLLAWDPRTARRTRVLAEPGVQRCVAYSPDGKMMVYGAFDGLRLIDASTGTVLVHTEEVACSRPFKKAIWFSHDGRTVVSMRYEKGLVWSPSSNKVVALVGHSRDIATAQFSPDGRLVATAAEDGSARVWDTATGAQLASFQHGPNRLTAASFNPDGSRVLVASEDGKARLWDWRGRQQTVELLGHTRALTGAQFSKSGKQVLTTSWDGTARLFDVASGQTIMVFGGHTDGVVSGMFSPDERHVITGGADGTVRLWLASSEGHSSIGAHSGEVIAVAFSPDGQQLVSASKDNTAKIWNVEDGTLIRSLEGHAKAVWDAEFSRDGRWVATASEDNTARIWRLDRDDPPLVLQGHEDLVWQATLNADGRFAATRSADHTVRVWDARTGTQLMKLEGFSNLPAGIAFAPNTAFLATALGDKVDIWDVETLRKFTTIRRKGVTFEKLSFDASGERLLAKTSARSVVAWNWRTGNDVGVLSNAVTYAFSADGRFAVGKEYDGEHDFRLWDVAANKDLAILDGTAGVNGQVAIGPDHHRVALPKKNGTIEIRSIFASPQELVERAKHAVSSCLTEKQRRDAFLTAEPPRWCITGAGREREQDLTKWQPKWPYHTEAWRNWLASRDRGEELPLPEASSR